MTSNDVIMSIKLLLDVGFCVIMSGFNEEISEGIEGQPPTLPRPRSQEAQKNPIWIGFNIDSIQYIQISS